MNLNQITIPSRDLIKSVEFYKILGLQLIVDAVPNYVRFVCSVGNSTFSVHLVEKLPTGNGPVIYFECLQLDEEYKRLTSLGVEFEHPPKDQNWLWREARLADPDGNSIILYFAAENRLNPPWKIS